MKVELMGKYFNFLTATFSILFLNSCAVSGIAIGVGGTLYGIHYEANAHFPDKVPDLPEFPKLSNIFKLSKDSDLAKSSVKADAEYGFDCTKSTEFKDSSQCFERFIKSLSIKDNQNKIDQKRIKIIEGKATLNNGQQLNQDVKTNQNISEKVLIPQKNIEESVFFEEAGTDKVLNKPKVIKKELVADGLQKRPATLTLKPKSQEDISNTRSINSAEFISSQLLSWVNAWEKRDIGLYLSFYSKDFVGVDGSRYNWEAARQNALKSNSNISVEISNINIYQNGNLIEANFTQKYMSDTYSDVGIKELIWKNNETGWKIIKETWIPKDDSSEAKELDKPINFVSSNLLNWLKAWQNQNINVYVSFYSKDFQDPERSRSEWEAYRHRALKANSGISIQVSNIKVHQREKIIEVNFTQHFKSDIFSDVGIKELVWKKKGNSWKIIRETWVPS